MRTLLCVFVGSVLLVSAGMAADQKSPTSNRHRGEYTSEDVRRAIEFQRAKDRADARQLAIEAKHPSVFYNRAERNADENSNSGRNRVKDPGERPVKK